MAAFVAGVEFAVTAQLVREKLESKIANMRKN